ncbi:TPA: Shedu anti-phage system protein SduA domain-containing protein [Raoultella ornithinolytica]
MNLDNFSILCKRVFDRYYKEIELEISKGNIIHNGKVVNYVYYPTTLLCVESEGELLSVELLGLTKTRKPLKIKKRNNISVREVTSIKRGGDVGSSFIEASSRGRISNIMFSDEEAKKFHDAQGNVLSNKFKTLFKINDGITHLVGFSKGFKSFLVSDCLLSYISNNIYRLRYINQLMMFNLGLNEEEIISDMTYYIWNEGGEVLGVRYFSDERELPWVKASYLMNLVLNDKIHETTIGDYLNDHSDILLKALGYKNMIYEPSLKWLEKTRDNPDTYINPDALLQRGDDFYDICDFKKGLTKRKSLTKDERRRRRFVDEVNEGLAQLDNYEEYFTFALNARYAMEYFNVKVSTPKKILIIGNIENAKQDEIEQSLRGRNNVLVVDYDSLVSSYITAII